MPAKVPRIEQHCLVCGKSTFVRPREFEQGRGKFCSCSCTRRYYPTYQRPIGTELVERIEIPCEKCGKVFRVRPGDEYDGSTGRRRRFCSQKCADQSRVKKTQSERALSTQKCLQCGKTFIIPTCWFKKKNHGRFCSRSCNATYHAQDDKVGYQSKLELLFIQALNERKIKHQSQYQVGQYFLDIAFPKQKTAIECDGDYWHNVPKQIAKDKRKDAYLKHKGWTVFRFWEHDILKDVEACVEQVLAYLNFR
jgi:DNA mismatch endonuclease (patch repair protein)